MKTIKYGELLNLAREKDMLRDLDNEVKEIASKLSVVLGEHVVYDSLRPLRIKLVSMYLNKRSQYNDAFEEYFKQEYKRICP